MSDDPNGMTAKDYALAFIACFAIDSFGKLDIRWNRDLQFACAYDLLFSVPDHETQKTVYFCSDGERCLLILLVLMGIATDNIRWQVGPEGKLVVTALSLPERIVLRGNDGDEVTVTIGGDDFLNPRHYGQWRGVPQSEHRKYLDKYYGGDPLKEITQIYNILNNVLWRLANG